MHKNDILINWDAYVHATIFSETMKMLSVNSDGEQLFKSSKLFNSLPWHLIMYFPTILSGFSNIFRKTLQTCERLQTNNPIIFRRWKLSWHHWRPPAKLTSWGVQSWLCAESTSIMNIYLRWGDKCDSVFFTSSTLSNYFEKWTKSMFHHSRVIEQSSRIIFFEINTRKWWLQSFYKWMLLTHFCHHSLESVIIVHSISITCRYWIKPSVCLNQS